MRDLLSGLKVKSRRKIWFHFPVFVTDILFTIICLNVILQNQKNSGNRLTRFICMFCPRVSQTIEVEII